jgi:hypothetical protein
MDEPAEVDYVEEKQRIAGNNSNNNMHMARNNVNLPPVHLVFYCLVDSCSLDTIKIINNLRGELSLFN